MKTVRIREKIKQFLAERPRNTTEIMEHINSTMRWGTTSQQLGNVLSKDKDILKVGLIRRSGLLSGGYDICEWATRAWVTSHFPDWTDGSPIAWGADDQVGLDDEADEGTKLPFGDWSGILSSVQLEERREIVLQLLIEGNPVRQIAALLGVTHAAATNDMRWLKSTKRIVQIKAGNGWSYRHPKLSDHLEGVLA